MLKGHMKCRSCAGNLFHLKGHTIPYLARDVWYLVKKNVAPFQVCVPLIVCLPPKVQASFTCSHMIMDTAEEAGIFTGVEIANGGSLNNRLIHKKKFNKNINKI